ncbi:MAG: T9SS type A sorting domain-containing protein [Candidatus Kapabacteria bacterium]|nr:T9SS type A sorting domain-containing protein [Candidatus Kapabacteria bacterium]
MVRPLLIVCAALASVISAMAQSDLAPLKVTTNIAPAPGFLLLAPNCRVSPRPFGSYLGAYNVNGGVIRTGKTTNYPFEFKVFPDGRLGYSELVVFSGASVPAGVYIVDTLFAEQERLDQRRAGYLTTQHDVHMLPNGHRILLGAEDVTVDMSKVVPGGHPAANVVQAIIQELDVEGNVVSQWRALDHLPITDSYEDLTAPAIRYCHNNSLWIDDDGNWIVSMRHMSQVIKIDRRTGEVMWKLGGKSNQFTFEGDHPELAPTYFSYQHDARRLPNGNISLFDNGTQHNPQYSRGVEYQLDEEKKTCRMVWEYRPTPDIYVSIQGGLQTLEGGHRLLGWGSGATNGSPGVTEVDSLGNVVFEAYYPKQMFVYRATKVPAWPTGRASATAVARDVLKGETYRYYRGTQFVGLRAEFTTLDSYFYNVTTARRFQWSPKNPLWDGEAPLLKQARVDVTVDGIKDHRMTMRFQVDTLMLGRDAGKCMVYYRPQIDSGQFTMLTTRFDAVSRELVVENAQAGEFVFGVPATDPGAPRLPQLKDPIADRRVLGDSAYALRVSVPGRSDSLHVHVSRTTSFASLVLDSINADDRVVLPAGGQPGRYYWRARAKTLESWSQWSAIDSFLIDGPYLTLTRPDVDVRWMHDSSYIISWQTNLLGSVAIDLMLGEYVIASIEDSIPARAQGFLWKVPVSTPVSKNFQIRISPREAPYMALSSTSPTFVEIVTFTSVDDQPEEMSPVSIMPQPAGDVLSIVNVGSGLRSIRMFAATGQQVLWQAADGTRRELDVSGFAAGLYVVVIEDQLGRTFTHRVIVDR